MPYLLILAAGIIIGLIVIAFYSKRVLSPPETYIDPNAPMTRCSHCHTVITKKNATRHGVNCDQRSPDKPSPSTSKNG